MVEHDFPDFSAMFDGVMALYPNAKPTTPAQKAMFFRALHEHPIEAVRHGFDAHVKNPQNGRFQPLPADVIGNIREAATDDGRPGAEEAWSGALAAKDEAATVVWTAEAAEAWGAARVVLEQGDEVGARMAFKEVYTRAVAAARSAQKPIAWSASLGFDKESRERALSEAVRLGRISQAGYLELAPPPKETLLQLEGPGSANMPQEVRERLRALRDSLSSESRSGLDWAFRLREREHNGETLTAAQSASWRAVLLEKQEVDAPPMLFKPIPVDALPEGMRP